MTFKYHSEMNLLNFDAGIPEPDPAHFRQEHESKVGRSIYEVLTSRDGRLVAAIATHEGRPIVPAMEPFIAHYVGAEAFTDRMKQYTGFAAKHVAVSMGGQIERRGVDVVRPGSRYTKATKYRKLIPAMLG